MIKLTKTILAASVLAHLSLTIAQAATVTWDDGAPNDYWDSGGNWDTGVEPGNGDSVALGSSGDIRLRSTFTIESGQSLTASGTTFNPELILEGSASVLTLNTGGTMDIVFMRPRFSAGGQFIIESGASLDTGIYGLSSVAGDMKFIADASGVTTWFNSGSGSGNFSIGADTLTVDLSNYDDTNGDTLILVDYEVGALSGNFASVNLTAGWTGTIDYAYDQGSGDLAIALTNIVSPDVTAPIISLLGDNPQEVLLGTTFTDPAATASDDRDGDITASITVSGTVDTGTVGAYILSYDVSDAAGNVATTVSRIVNVMIPVITWTDSAGDELWSSGGNWDSGLAPVNGDSVVLVPVDQSQLDYAWVIENGRSLTSTGSGVSDEINLVGSNAILTLASGGSMNVGFLRPRFTDGGRFIIEASASLNTDTYGLASISGNIEFIADAAGVTTWINASSFTAGADHLSVDLSNYDIANGTTLVLIDYEGNFSGEFATVTLTDGWVGIIDNGYDQGGGDLAVAITDLVEPVDPITWDDGAGDDYWSSATNWDGNILPISGDSVVLGASGDIRLDTAFTIEYGRSVIATGSGYNPELILEGSAAVLTLATGGILDIAFFRPRYTAGAQFIIEANASLNTDIFHATVANSITYIADAAGVTTWHNSEDSNFSVGNSALVVDLSDYDPASGDTLVLVDYAGSLSDVFTSVTFSDGWSGVIDYAFDQGGGDLAIALTGITRLPVLVTTPGISLEFDGYAVPVSVTNSLGDELLSGATSAGFYLLEANGSTRFFDKVSSLGGNAYRFSMYDYPESFDVVFDGKNDYITIRFTALNDFPLLGERLYFELDALSDDGLRALGLDYMVEVTASVDVKVQRRSLWETDTLGGFALYERIDDAAEDETLLDLWVDEGMAHPDVAGVWDRATAEAWLDDWIDEAYDTTFLNINPTDLAQHDDFLPYAQLLGAKAIYLNNRVWNGQRQNGIQDDEINPAMYPNGLTDMLAFRDTLAANDIDLMYHYMSGYLHATDPEFLAGSTTVDPGVASWGRVTLDGAISNSSTSMTVIPDAGVVMPVVSSSSRPLQAPPVIPSGFNFKTFRIGDEWMKASSITDMGDGTWQLDGVTRAQWNTTAQSYSEGTNLLGYVTKNNFSSDPDSVLTETLASRWADLSNTVGLTHSAFDGAYWRMGQGFWSFEKYATLVYQNLDHPTSSNTSHGRAPQAWLEYNFNRVKAAMNGDFQTREQISFVSGNESRTASSLEEMEYNAYSFLQVNNRGFSVGVNGTLGVSLSSFEEHGQTGEILGKLNEWKKASLGMSLDQRELMNTYSADGLDLGAKHWAESFWRLEGSFFRRWYGLGTELYNHEWYLGQEHGTVTPRFYLKNGEVESLLGSDDLTFGFDQVRVVGRVLPKFDANSVNNIDLMAPMGVGSSLTVARTNNSSSAFMNESALVNYNTGVLDLSGHTGLGMYVTGDGSGATLVVRLKQNLARDYTIPINFTGRKWVEIPTGEQGWRLRNWGWSSSTKKTISYNSIKTISIGIGYLPSNTSCSVVIDGLQALDEISEPMVNPTITVGNQSVSVSGTIETGNHFILDQDGGFTIYDEHWNIISSVFAGSLQPADLATFSMQSTASSSDVWLEVGVQASTEIIANPDPDLAVTWAGGSSGSWNSGSNWDGNTVPASTDHVTVGASSSVSDGSNDFASLKIMSGATLTMADHLSANIVDVAGTLNAVGVFRVVNSVIDLSGHLGSGTTFLDTNGSEIYFYDGASFLNASMSFEHKGLNTFGYILSEAGFTTIQAGGLKTGGGATWADATYYIDISAYDSANGSSIVLVDYTSIESGFGTFAPTVEVYVGESGLDATLSFDSANSSLVLTVF